MKRELHNTCELAAKVARIVDEELDYLRTQRMVWGGDLKRRRLEAFDKVCRLVDEHTVKPS